MDTSGSGASAATSAAGRTSSLRRALTKYAVMALILIAILIPISGRLDWIRAWLYIAVTLGIQLIVGLILHRRQPDLLVERSKLQQGTKSFDKILAPVVAIAGPLAMWLVAGWDVRVHWPPPVPVLWSAVAFAVCLVGSVITGWAMVTNAFFSATVRIQSDRAHRVVDTGPYRYVRHPGYTGAILYTLASPVALGSWYALIPAFLVMIALIVRTLLEERTLRVELPGYEDYFRRTGSRFIPGI